MKSYALREPMSAGARENLRVYPELLQELLFYRGVKTPEQAEAFLNPNYETHTHDPFLMKDMDKAVSRILKAIEKNERIMIYSDYDADGIPAGVILHDFFKKIGYMNFANYFPHRHDEGFGFHKAAVEKFSENGTGGTDAEGPVKLLITADCGIADVEAVTRANELGIDVILSDHHLAPEKLPPAYAILDPKQLDCDYPYDMLCGSGVAFKLIQAILKKNSFGLKEGMEKWFLDMVGLATLADMVPLQGENRVFAHYGLKVLRKSPRLGLMKLLSRMKIDQRYLSEDDLGFMVVPRINAASRMGLPRDAFELLTASDDISADRLSKHLDDMNTERKTSAAVITKEVKKHLTERMVSETGANAEGKKPLLVIGNPNWKPPMLGPVANSLMETYHVPVFLWGRADETVLKGSARSDGIVSLLELMQTVEKIAPGTFIAYGGHRASGGFSISHEKIHSLEETLVKAYEHIYAGGAQPVAEPVNVDRKMIFDDVNWKTYGMIEQLSPFGEANAKPLFLFENVLVDEVKQFGKEKNHLELRFKKSDGKSVPAIGFFATPEKYAVPVGKDRKINLVATLEKSYFRNYPELRLRIVDIF